MENNNSDHHSNSTEILDQTEHQPNQDTTISKPRSKLFITLAIGLLTLIIVATAIFVLTSSPSILPNQTSSTSWSTYVDPDDRFIVSYPDSWLVDVLGNADGFGTASNVTVALQANRHADWLSIFIGDLWPVNDSCNQDCELEIDDMQAPLIVSEKQYSPTITRAWNKNTGKIYFYTFQIQIEDFYVSAIFADQSELDVINQIVSTIQPHQISNKISGQVFQISPEHKAEIIAAFTPFGLGQDYSGFMIQANPTFTGSSDDHAQYYLAYDFSQLNTQMFQDLIPGSCVTVNVEDVKPALAPNYLDRITIFSASKLKIHDDLDCYVNFEAIDSTDSRSMLQITGRILEHQRVAYDIGQDYQIQIPFDLALSKGYIDSSGLVPRSPGEMIEVIVIPASTDIAKQLYTFKENKKLVTLTGRFEWGYSESMNFVVTDITE